MTSMRINKGSGPRINPIERTKLTGANMGFRENRGSRLLGMGAFPGRSSTDQEKVRAFGAIVNSIQNTPTFNIPTIDNVTWHFDGPLTDEAIQATFGASINLCQPGVPEGAVQVDSTFAEPGKFQTFALICGIQWRIDVEPASFTAPVNLWTSPISGAAAPVSPDVFSVADVVANGPLGLLAGQTMVPGALEWGWWMQEAAYYMNLGYNLQWQYGHNYNLINDTLRNTSFVSTTGDGSASSSEQDILYYLRQTNDYYRDTLVSPFTALPIDRVRLGNMTLVEAAGLSVFKPSRAYDRVGVTYGGGSASRQVRSNAEFRRMTVPFLAWPGVPLGLKAQVSNLTAQKQMQNFMSATCGFGGSAPAAFTADANINVGSGVGLISGQTSQEPSLDNPSAPEYVGMFSQRMPVKGGRWSITMAFKGYELTPDQASTVQTTDMRTAIQTECNCGMGVPGASA
jgi:hypothetical protein